MGAIDDRGPNSFSPSVRDMFCFSFLTDTFHCFSWQREVIAAALLDELADRRRQEESHLQTLQRPDASSGS